MTPFTGLDAPITRREAIRRVAVFSTGTLAAAGVGPLFARPPRIEFAGDGIHLLALGDFGAKRLPSQVAVAVQMARFAESLGRPLAAVLALGDNFYRRITPDRFRTDFEQLYSPQHLACPFYACAGNHDYGTARYDLQEGKLQMQLDYARNNPQSRWKMPAKWYTVELPAAGEPLVKVIVLDGNYWEGGLTPQEKIDQKRFLKAELEAERRAPWVWVVNHFPMFSESTARGDNQALIRDWGPLLQAHPVSLFLAGHDHTLQHLEVEGYRPSFVVSGAGGAPLYDIRSAERGYADNRNFGFNHIHVTSERFEVQFINAQGDCLHALQRNLDGQVQVRNAA